MCSIFGWIRGQDIDLELKAHVVINARDRGRDGWGFWIDEEEYRGLGELDPGIVEKLMTADRVVGNFRAIPTTEVVSTPDNLQPYKGVVHNGVIANDKEFGEYKIDSMVLGDLLPGCSNSFEFLKRLEKIKGSYALAFFQGRDLYLAANYKPIYWTDRCGGWMFASQAYMLPPDSYPVAFQPYSLAVVDGSSLAIAATRALPTDQPRRVVVSCSGGLDSVTVAYMLRQKGYEVCLAHFLYNCLAENREVERVRQIAAHGGFEMAIIQLPTGVMAGSITEGRFDSGKNGITGAEYAVDWVSARNLLMLSCLTAYAETNHYGYIAFGGNLEESGAYPDNEEEFGNRFNAILPYSTQNGIKIELLQPLATLMKHEIVKKGLELNVPFELTWSCYGDGEKHCGVCGPCYMRKTAFERNGHRDPVMTDAGV